MKNIIIVLFAFSIIACDDEVDKTLGRKVIIPSTLELLSKSNVNLVDSNQREELKLVCLVNAGCNACIDRVNSWQNFIDTLAQLDVKTHIILRTINPKSLKKYFFKKFEVDAIYYLDSCYAYFDKNSDLFLNENINTNILLLDSSERIQMYGNPFINQTTKDIYLFAIRKFKTHN